MHRHRVITLDIPRRITVPVKKRIELFAAYSRKNRRAGDFVAIQMEDWQHSTIVNWIKKFIRVPTRRQWSGLCLAITDLTDDWALRDLTIVVRADGELRPYAKALLESLRA